MPLTLQIRAVFAVPLTETEKVWTPPTTTLAEEGETTTETAEEDAACGAAECDLPQAGTKAAAASKAMILSVRTLPDVSRARPEVSPFLRRSNGDTHGRCEIAVPGIYSFNANRGLQV